jgi:D-alanine-D-alanine ligase
MKIAVLLGGTSTERDVSISTGIAIARALRENGHTVQAIDCAYGNKTLDFENMSTADIIRVTPSDIEKEKARLDRNIFSTIDYLVKEKITLVFNALHGGYGENGQLPSLLDLVKIPYTGSGTLASALGMDKHLSKIIFQSNNVPTAPWERLDSPGEFDARNFQHWELPLVVKPNAQGSTVGLSIVKSWSEFYGAVEKAFQYDDTVLVEKYIPDREITVSMLGKESLPIIEIIPESGFYDYEAKYQSGKTKYVVPAEIPPNPTMEIQQAALRAYNGLRCRGYARVDFRLQADGRFFCLEVNTLPGMTPTSLVPKAAKALGISFNELIERIVKFAVD